MLGYAGEDESYFAIRGPDLQPPSHRYVRRYILLMNPIAR
jgi:hypothetical protein